MGRLGACFRLLVVVKLTVFGYLIALGGYTLAYPLLHYRDRWRRLCLRFWSRAVLRVMGARIERRRPVPVTPSFVVPRHLDWLYILVLVSRVDTVFVSGGEIAGRPVVRALCRAAGAVFVDDCTHSDPARVAAKIRPLLERGDAVVLCPEGTTNAGWQVDPFRSELLEIVSRAGYPVFFSSLEGAAVYKGSHDDPAVRGRGNMEFVDHLWRLLSEPGFTVTLTFGDRPNR